MSNLLLSKKLLRHQSPFKKFLQMTNFTRQYFVLPNCYIAFNAKVASSALASAIVKKYYPDKLKQAKDDWNNTWAKFSQEFKDSLPESFQIEFQTDFENSKSFWQNVCVRDSFPNKKVLLAVRDPIVRFASTCAYMKVNPEEMLVALENKSKAFLDGGECFVYRNTHFLPQYIYMDENCKAYKFPSQLEQLCVDAELDWPLPKINEGKFEKPILTEQQILRIKQVYSQDFELFENI